MTAKEPTPTDPLDEATLGELRRLARSRPKNGRDAVAKLGAIRTLERLSRARGRSRSLEPAVARLFDDSRDPEARVADDEWLPASCNSPDVRAIYACDTVDARRRWYRNLLETGRL